MTMLKEQVCTACGSDPSLLSDSEINRLLTQLVKESKGWQVIEEQGLKKLSHVFVTKRYKASMVFCNDVAALAESVNHHPLMVVEYGEVTVQWWSHNIKGLHQIDFIMAAKTSALLTL